MHFSTLISTNVKIIWYPWRFVKLKCESHQRPEPRHLLSRRQTIQNCAQRNRPCVTVCICGLWWNPAFCPRHCLRQKIPTCGKCDFLHRKYGCWTIQPTCWHVTAASAQLTLQAMHSTKQMNCVHLQSAQIECLQQHICWHCLPAGTFPWQNMESQN